MEKDDAFIQSVLNKAVDILVDMFGTIQKTGGAIGERVNPKEQMAAYMELRDLPISSPEWQELLQHYGPEEVTGMIKTMESRIARMSPNRGG